VGKGDRIECASYRGMKLLEHAMEVVEKVFEQQIDVDDMQFGFMKGEGTIGAMFVVRQMQDKFRVKSKNLVLDLSLCGSGKVLVGVPREVIRWAMHKLGAWAPKGMGKGGGNCPLEGSNCSRSPENWKIERYLVVALDCLFGLL